MAEYISRETMINLLQSMADNAEANGFSYDREVIEAVRVTLAGIPAADVAPVRHGQWIVKGYVCGETEYQCSECKETEWRTSASRLKYCPFCGAKMDGERKEGANND